MESNKKKLGDILCEIGCAFRSNINSHIKDYKLQKVDDVEWLLEPLTEIGHPSDLVLDAFCCSWDLGSSYVLYFHKKNASQVYVPYDEPFKEPSFIKKEGNKLIFLKPDEVERPPEPNVYDPSMLIKGEVNGHTASRMPKIWRDLTIPFTEIGIWQAVLLSETIAMFPKGWHDNYMECDYVFSVDDMKHIVNRKKTLGESYFDNAKLALYLDRDDIFPTVEICGDKAVVTYHYWNDWSGFCKRIIPVERDGKSIKFGKRDYEVILKYHCRICF